MLYVTVIGALFLTWFVLVLLFTPALNYRMRMRVPVSSPEFLHLLESTCQAATHGGNRAEVFTDGPCFYPAMIAAIRAAETSVNLECYIFNAGEVADEFVRALAERAKAGVVVTIVGRRDWQLRHVHGRGQHAHRRGLPGGVVSARHVVSPRAVEQPDAQGDPGRRRVRRVRRRRRNCGLVDDGNRPRSPAVARHDGSPRGPRCRRDPRRVRRELAGVLRRDTERPRVLPGRAPQWRHDGDRDQELAFGSRNRVARRLPGADRGRGARRADCHTLLPAGPHPPGRARRDRRSAAFRSSSSCPDRAPTSGGYASRAAGSTANSSPRACGSSSTSLR